MSTNLEVRRRTQGLQGDVKKAADDATVSPLMENLTRLGYLVRGLVYGVIGILALKVVLGKGGALTDPQGAIAAMGRTPLGTILLYVVLAGLVGYGLWGLVRAIVDPQHQGTDFKGIMQRVGYAASGVSYLVLGWATLRLIQRGASAAQNKAQTTQIQQTTGTLLTKPWGVWVVALAGLIVIGVGAYQIYMGMSAHLEQQFKPYSLSGTRRKWLIRLGRFGTAARGLVFSLVGVFLVLAAYHHDPSRAQGIAGVLVALLQQPYGPWLLGIVALGLIMFGFFSALSGLWLRPRKQA